MPEVNQTTTKPAPVALTIDQCGHSGQLLVALEKTDGDRFRLAGPKSMRGSRRVLHYPLTGQDARMIRRYLGGTDDGSDR